MTTSSAILSPMETETEPTTHPIRAWGALVVLGIALMASGLIWYLSSRPTTSEIERAEEAQVWDPSVALPEAAVAGPIVLAALGALALLLGVIVWTGSDRS